MLCVQFMVFINWTCRKFILIFIYLGSSGYYFRVIFKLLQGFDFHVRLSTFKMCVLTVGANFSCQK